MSASLEGMMRALAKEHESWCQARHRVEFLKLQAEWPSILSRLQTLLRRNKLPPSR